MNGNKLSGFLAGLFLVTGLLSIAAVSEGIEAGMAAPPFRLESGDERTISSDQLRGRIILLLYETKETVEENRLLKNEITAFYARSLWLKARSVVVPVINCSSAYWPISKIWQSNLVKNSKKERLVIYGDWDGKMFKDYGMKDNTSNVLIIDGAGVVRYFRSGGLSPGEVRLVTKLLKKLSGN